MFEPMKWEGMSGVLALSRNEPIEKRNATQGGKESGMEGRKKKPMKGMEEKASLKVKSDEERHRLTQ